MLSWPQVSILIAWWLVVIFVSWWFIILNSSISSVRFRRFVLFMTGLWACSMVCFLNFETGVSLVSMYLKLAFLPLFLVNRLIISLGTILDIFIFIFINLPVLVLQNIITNLWDNLDIVVCPMALTIAVLLYLEYNLEYPGSNYSINKFFINTYSRVLICLLFIEPSFSFSIFIITLVLAAISLYYNYAVYPYYVNHSASINWLFFLTFVIVYSIFIFLLFVVFWLYSR